MRILLTTSLLLSLAMGLHKNVEKTGKLIDESKVTYNLSDDKKLDGAYVIRDAADVTRLRGSYKDNSRAGDWYCFDAKGNMVLRYNYTASKLLSLDQGSISALEVKIMDKNPEIANNARIPIPICSVDQFKKMLQEELKDQIPNKEKTGKVNVTADFLTLIDANGSPKYMVTYAINNIEYKANLSFKDKLFNVEWLPAKYNDKTYKSEVRFSSSFELDPTTFVKRFVWNY